MREEPHEKGINKLQALNSILEAELQTYLLAVMEDIEEEGELIHKFG